MNTILKNTRKEGKKHILFAFIISTFVFLLSCNENSDRVVVFPKVYTELGEITGTIANPDSIQAPRVSPFIMPKGEFLKAPQIIPRKKKQSSIHSIPVAKKLSTPRIKHVNLKSQEVQVLPLKASLIPAEAPFMMTPKGRTVKGNRIQFEYDEVGSVSPNNIYQVEDGSIWFSSYWRGAYCFDGTNLLNYTEQTGLPSTHVFEILEDRDGDLWICNLKGITKYDGTQFFNYGLEEGIKTTREVIEDKDGKIWLLGIETIHCINKKDEQIYNFNSMELFGEAVQGIQQDQGGNIWFGIKDSGMVVLPYLENKTQSFTFLQFTEEHGLRFERQDEPTHQYSFFNDSTNRMWMATNFGVFSFNGFENGNWDQLSYIFYNRDQGLTFDMVFRIIEEKKDHFLLGNQRGIDVLKFSKDHQTYTLNYINEGYKVKSFLKDFNENIWLGHDYKPIEKKKEVLIKSILDDFDTRVNAHAVVEDQWGNIWLGTYGYGLYCLRKDKEGRFSELVAYTKEQGLPSNYTDDLEIDQNGNLWLSYRNACVSVLELTDKGKTVKHKKIGADQGIPAYFIPNLFKDQSENIWICANPFTDLYEAGVYKFDGSNLTYYSKQQGLIDKRLYSMEQDLAGDYWFPSAINGIAKFSPDDENNSWTYFNAESGLPVNEIGTVCTDSYGSVWLCSSQGLFQLIPIKQSEGYRLRKFHFDNVRSIFEDTDRNLWLIGKNLIKLNYAKIEEENEDPPFSIITEEEGYNTAPKKAILQDQNENIWMSTKLFPPNYALEKKEVRSMQLLNVILFNEKINWKQDTTITLSNGIEIKNTRFDGLSKWTLQPKNLSLSYKNNYIGFVYSAIETSYPEQLVYKHTLEGLQDYWSISNRETKVNFAGLQPGNYTFKVKARIGNGEWSEALVYPFRVRPPWYRSIIAYIIYTALIIGFIIYFIRSKIAAAIRKLKEIEVMRTRISSDLHDDVGTILAGVAMQAEILALNDNNEDKEELKELSTFTRTAMEKMRDIVWAMDSRKDKYENLIEKMMHFANTHLKDSQFICHFEIKEIQRESKLKPDVRQNLYLVFKEAITNIRKHSNGNKVEVNLKKEKDQLIFRVTDNGDQIPTAKTDGLGLSNMKMRAEKIGAQFFVNKEQGFEIGIILPI